MYTDYKIVKEILEDDKVVSQTVRFYVGEITTKDEENPDTYEMEPVTRYRRSALEEEITYEYAT